MTMPLWRPAYIGVGSNLDSPVEQVKQGIASLAGLPRTVVALTSGLYRSSPMGPKDQPDFINVVAAIMTQLEPLDLLAKLQEIELQQGRDRSAPRWGPRTLDLDLLAFAAVKMASSDLTLPHPGIAERNFVLLPWAEIAPHYRVPGLATVAELAQSAAGEEPHIEKIE